MSGYYPDGMTQASFDQYWSDRDRYDIESGACCVHGVTTGESCPDCEEQLEQGGD